MMSDKDKTITAMRNELEILKKDSRQMTEKIATLNKLLQKQQMIQQSQQKQQD